MYASNLRVLSLVMRWYTTATYTSICLSIFPSIWEEGEYLKEVQEQIEIERDRTMDVPVVKEGVQYNTSVYIELFIYIYTSVAI